MALKKEVGCFAWFSLMTRQPAEAAAFYKAALGLESSEYEIPGMGSSTILAAGGKQFAGCVPLEGVPDAVPNHWIAYLAVEDVDAACERAEALGGRVCVPAFDLPTLGRTAVINDPAGAAFHLYTPLDPSCDLNVVGEALGQVCWVELMVDDPQTVLHFYSELLGWKISTTPMPDIEYHAVEAAGKQVAGIMKRPADVPPVPPSWMPYFAVEKIDPANDKVEALGATLHFKSRHIPETGYFSLMQAPTGSHAYLFEWTPPAT